MPDSSTRCTGSTRRSARRPGRTWRGGIDQIRPDFVVEAFTNSIPLSRTNPEQIDEIRTWGRDRAVPAGRPLATSVPGQKSGGRRILVN